MKASIAIVSGFVVAIKSAHLVKCYTGIGGVFIRFTCAGTSNFLFISTHNLSLLVFRQHNIGLIFHVFLFVIKCFSAASFDFLI